MADNFAVTAGTGTTVATDDVGGVHYQRVKLVDGTLDSSTAIASGGGVEAGALRVTIASDSTGVVSIDDNGGAITVDGTLAVTNAGITTIAGAVAGTEMQVDVLTMPSVAVTNAGITSIDGKITACNTGAVVISSGTCTVDLGANNDVTVTNATAANLKCEEASASAIKTAVELIDNAISGSEMQVDVVTLPAVTGAVTANPSKLATTDDADFVRKYYTNAGAVTDGIVWSPSAGKRWYITDIIVNTSAAATITFEDDKTGGDDPVLKLELAANGGFVSNFKTPFASGEDAADLLITTTAGNCYVAITGFEV
jgi:hypothetical protein